MSGRTQLWLGSVMLALAIGLLLSSALFTRSAQAQQGLGEGRSRRYVMVTGPQGTAANTESVYIIDDVNRIMYAFEYHSRAKEMTYRAHRDLYLDSFRLLEKRDEGERKKGG